MSTVHSSVRVGLVEKHYVGGSVWALSTRGVLAQLNAATGRTQASISVGAVPHFATPTLWNGLVLVGTMSGVVAVTGS